MIQDRRSVLSVLGLSLPFGFFTRGSEVGPPPVLRFLSFEEAVRQAFADPPPPAIPGPAPDSPTCRRIEVGHSERLQYGVQGCENDRLFAGFPKCRLRIIRTGFEPGPVRGGARLYIATVDITLNETPLGDTPRRLLDFRLLRPAPTFVEEETDPLLAAKNLGRPSSQKVPNQRTHVSI